MFINYPHRKRTVPLRMIVPNLFTTVAMCSGLASLHYTLKGDWDRAVFAVILSAVFDSLDGRAARLLKVTSPFGEVLDSLADFLSFGIAPALLLYRWMFERQPGPWLDGMGLLAVTLFVVCSGMRLARFTAAARPSALVAAPAPSTIGGLGVPATPTEGDLQRAAAIRAKFFTGLATPSAGAAAMVPVMLSYSKLVGPWVRPAFGMPAAGLGDEAAGKLDSPALPEGWIAALVMVYTILIAIWMISRIPMFSFKKMRVNRRAAVPLLVAAGVVVVLAVKDFWLLIPLLTLVYLATAPVSWLSQRSILRRGT